jgi:SPP1 family predicted phage head-tail adaptor
MAYDPLILAAGDLRHSVSIQASSTSRDASGQLLQTWDTILTTHASIRSLTTRETVQDSQLVSQSTHMITIRYPGKSIRLVTGNKLVHGNNVYTIQEVDNVLSRNKVIQLRALVIDSDSV